MEQLFTETSAQCNYKPNGGTGYSFTRAATHDAKVAEVIGKLEKKGWKPKALEVDGHGPDIQCNRTPWNEPCYIELKTIPAGKPNLAIELECERDIQIREARGERVFLLVYDESENEYWVVKRSHLRSIWSVQPPTGSGSNDYWMLFQHPKKDGLGTLASSFFQDMNPSV